MKWAIGILTAPRPNGVTYLPETIASLAEAGWETGPGSEVVVFAEPNSAIPRGTRFIQNKTPLGPMLNWRHCAGTLRTIAPDADAYLISQDDAVYCRSARQIAETAPRIGLVSLYTSGRFAKRLATANGHLVDGSDAGGSGVKWFDMHMLDRQPRSFGTLAMMLTRLKIKIADHFHEPLRGEAPDDYELARRTRELAIPVYFPTRSLVDHIGDVSSLPVHCDNPSARRGYRFDREF